MHEILGDIVAWLQLCMFLIICFAGLIFGKLLKKDKRIVYLIRFLALWMLIVLMLIDFYFFNTPIAINP